MNGRRVIRAQPLSPFIILKGVRKPAARAEKIAAPLEKVRRASPMMRRQIVFGEGEIDLPAFGQQEAKHKM
jgi:hypothetical protein